MGFLWESASGSRENNKIKQNVQFEFEKKLERLYFEK